MWQTVTLILVASMARSSTTCPESCDCSDIGKNRSMEIRCDEGIAPEVKYLPENSQRLIVRGTKPYKVSRMLVDLEYRKNIALVELAITNCSLTSLNVSLSSGPTRVNLTNNNFGETRDLLIRDASNRVEVLDLSSNRLRRLRRGAFADYGQLLQLNLRGNAIETIEDGGFAGLSRLEGLDLSENQLGALLEDTFTPLCYLKILNLSGNKLLGKRQKSFEWLSKLDLALGSLRRLESIDVSRIGIDRVPSALTRSVRNLRLTGNGLKAIRDGDFDSYPLLRVLDLSYNLITIVEDDALGRLEILEYLDLSGNQLTTVPQSLPSGLRSLVLRENFIGKIASKDLQVLGKLERLVLRDNGIRSIEDGSMDQQLLLKELDVSNNPIEQLPANTFGGPGNLVVLRMSGLSLLEWQNEKLGDMAFPVPSPERLVSLDLSGSPALAAQLLADEAALSACKSLRQLNIARTNLTVLRSDLPYLLPQLRTLGLSGNRWNCTKSLNWLARWLKDHEEMQPRAKCTFNDRTDLVDLPDDFPSATEFNGIDDTRISERRFVLGAHPGMLILACAAIGTLALSVTVLFRRRIPQPVDNLEGYDQRRPIVTCTDELW